MNDEQMKKALENATELSKLANKITNTISQSLLKMIESIRPIINQVSNIMATEFMTGFSNALSNFAADIEKVKNNPNTYFSYMKYQKNLDSMHWAWPYEIEAHELKIILENANSEKDFDALMVRFFTKDKTDSMIQEMLMNLPSRHKMMLKQAKNAFDRKDYAIANNALMTIIDNMLSEYLVNKGQGKRVGILEPIIEYYEGFPLDEVDFIFELCMLSNNIDFIFQDYRFNEKIEIKTNKKIRRHTSLHGVQYSNKKVDTLLLFNTLVNFVRSQEILKIYKSGLIVNKQNKKFAFSPVLEKKLVEKKCMDFIISTIQFDGKVDHNTLLNEMIHCIPTDTENKGKYLSMLLQKMKRANKIKCEKIDGKNYWLIFDLLSE